VSDFKKQEGDILRERYPKRTSLPNTLSTNFGQTLVNLLRVHPGISNYIIIFKREKFL